jgi:hypothetical protein
LWLTTAWFIGRIIALASLVKSVTKLMGRPLLNARNQTVCQFRQSLVG